MEMQSVSRNVLYVEFRGGHKSWKWSSCV